jgi:hypothetical protein
VVYLFAYLVSALVRALQVFLSNAFGRAREPVPID